MKYLSKIIGITLLALFVANLFAKDQLKPVHLKFDFSAGEVAKGYTQILPNMKYSTDQGYGIICDPATIVSAVNRDGKDALKSDFLTSGNPFLFVVDLPEGNYDVTLILGDIHGKSVTTVKAEARRFMLGKVETENGKIVSKMFTTNIRYSSLNDSVNVKLKRREVNHPDWDHQLSIEFSDARPCVCGVEIKSNENAPTIFLAGNSTVTDQVSEPWAAWGQMLPYFFNPGKISVANYAESGEAMKSFLARRKLDKIVTQMKAGDYLFIQFGHNDQKPQSSSYVKPFAGYKDCLKIFINAAREKGAYPVLVTSMHRRKFDANGKIINTHGDYPEAMRQTAKEENVPLIDLHAMSRQLYEALGVEGSRKALVHYPANTFKGQTKALADNSHHSTYGAFQLAKCVVEGIRMNKLVDLVQNFTADVRPYNPAHPDPFEEWDWPVSPSVSSVTPEGF
jgi:lysophospholipase L1-like esterase